MDPRVTQPFQTAFVRDEARDEDVVQVEDRRFEGLLLETRDGVERNHVDSAVEEFRINRAGEHVPGHLILGQDLVVVVVTPLHRETAAKAADEVLAVLVNETRSVE